MPTGAWSVPNFEWGSLNNLQPGQAFLVGRTMLETDRLSPERERRCNAMDEILGPTEFHRQVFADSGVKADKKDLQSLVSLTDKLPVQHSADCVCPQAKI